MKSRWMLPLLSSLVLGACASPAVEDQDGLGGSSGEAGQSGSGTGGGIEGGGTGGVDGTGTGGKIGTGGVVGTGGIPGTGTGGKIGTGGAMGTGGVAGTGGIAGTGTGGKIGTGGAVGTGGIAGTGTGGKAGSGGAVGTGGKAGSGGAVGTGGATGTGGTTTTAPGVCTFASGLNVAWVSFANDIPSPNLTTFNTLFKNTYAAGGRVVRWWLHTNGTVTPGYDTGGKAKPLTTAAINAVVSVLNAAHAAGVAINLSLWSFDMLQGGENISSALRTNNQNLLTVDANRQAYIDNVLTPLATALKGNPGLYSYEIFNEPEGMTTQHGWTGSNGGTEVDESFIQKTVNWFSAAIKAVDPVVLVTNAAWEFQACSTVKGMTNYYSNSALQSAGGKSTGILDFYEVHYYASNGSQYSAFTHKASYWGLDKDIVMGEFYALATDGTAANDTYTTLYSNGYNGAWAWQYESNDGGNNGNTKWPAMQVPMQNLYSAHTADINSCP
jgi:hypothetical protein